MSHFGDYFTQLAHAFSKGNATEHTFRPALKTLLESLSPGIVATNEPKRIQCGAPDYILTRGETPLGYVEAKDIGEPLDKIETSDQMKRYRESLGNLILTDYVEFRWYVGGQHRLTASLGTGGAKTSGGKKPLVAAPHGEAQVEELLQAFLQAQVPTVSSPKELAGRMAHLAKLVRETISRALLAEDKGGTLHQQFEGFRKVLLHDLTPELFADMYAQTIAYGLFAARCNSKPGQRFTRYLAPHQLPKTNPFLRKTFGYIAGADLDDRVVWVVDDLAELLDRADMEAILQDFGHRTRQEDPVVHFYETFLAAYDPKMREARGVYYTPEPVVSYIVRSVDQLLKEDFGLKDGLADSSKVTVPAAEGKGTQEVHRVQILDPATGTGTFLHGVVDHIAGTYAANKGMWSAYVSQHLLPRLFGFELLVAPYAVAHLKLGLQLAETGYDFRSDERLGIYLTNTLEEGDVTAGTLPFAGWIAEEANAAGRIKSDAPVMVVLGNPPYSYESGNTGAWIMNLIRAYYQVDGEALKERNSRGLQDDYVKFFRFAQRRIEQTGYGILAFISNNGYIDNPTFRGMRQSLLNTFDDIYILDLHGNAKKKERHPDGSEDKNVFDIQQGVSIGIFVKRLGSEKEPAKVRHAHFWGPRQHKYTALLKEDVASTSWNNIEPSKPFYLFTPQQGDLIVEYEGYANVSVAMPEKNVGIATSRDSLTIQFTKEAILATVKEFSALPVEEARDKFNLGKDADDWKVFLAQQDIKSEPIAQEKIRPIVYRPFDYRYTYYTNKSRGFISRPRFDIMRHMLKPNRAVYIGRQGQAVGGDEWNLIFCGKFIEDYNLYRRGNNACFPLYLYPTAKQSGLFAETDDEPQKRKANLAPEFIDDFVAKLGLAYIPDGHGDRQATFGPEDIFDYLYAVFHSPTYRARYAEFLKIDFPRLPLTAKPPLFRALCALGGELVRLHLMEQTGPNLPTYPVALPNDDPAQNLVGMVRYAEPTGGETGCVYINDAQYFRGIAPEVWNFHVGGYQVCQKWLKDRKGRTLTFDDIRHYQQIAAALAETIRLMASVDAEIAAQGGWPLI